MSDFLSKFENFIFDILGLALPGIIFIGIFVLPLLFVDMSSIPEKEVSSSFILSELSTLFKLFSSYWDTNPKLLLTILLILSYLIGHLVKVFAIIKYEFLTSIFDKTLNKVVQNIIDKINYETTSFFLRRSNTDINSKPFYKWLLDFLMPIKNTINKIFIFKPTDFFNENEVLKTTCVDIINTRIGRTVYPDKPYAVYKLSTIITHQENIKSLAGNFLAKYNLYRSLSFIFLFFNFLLLYIL